MFETHFEDWLSAMFACNHTQTLDISQVASKFRKCSDRQHLKQTSFRKFQFHKHIYLSALLYLYRVCYKIHQQPKQCFTGKSKHQKSWWQNCGATKFLTIFNGFRYLTKHTIKTFYDFLSYLQGFKNTSRICQDCMNFKSGYQNLCYLGDFLF